MTNLAELVRGVAEPYVLKKKDALLTIGLLVDEQFHTFAYGDNRLQHSVEPKDIIYEIGSISKVFTTSILAYKLHNGTMKLDHSISRYWPDIVDGHPMTIGHLATHTSGLPSYSIIREVRLAFSPKVNRDLYCQYSLTELRDWINARTAGRNKRVSYSNIGMGLLGLLMAWHEQCTFEELLERYMTRPFDMHDTFIAVTDARRDRIIQGHTVKGAAVQPLQLNDYQGAGAIRSTVSDLLRFLSAHMNAGDESALAPAHAARVRMGKRHAIGLGWIRDNNDLLFHNGATTGFSSFMGFHRQSRTGVVVLSNYRNSIVQDTPDRIAYEIMKALRK